MDFICIPVCTADGIHLCVTLEIGKEGVCRLCKIRGPLFQGEISGWAETGRTPDCIEEHASPWSIKEAVELDVPNRTCVFCIEHLFSSLACRGK